MDTTEKKPKPLKLWIQGQKLPLVFESSLHAQKELGEKFQQVTSGSIEIIERHSFTDGSTISGQSGAGLRNWAIRELDVCAATNKKLSFFDVKYKPEFELLDKDTGEMKMQPSRLVFRRSMRKEYEG